VAQLGIEGGQRLVEQQHLRSDRQRAGNRDALLLTTGKLTGKALSVRRHADHVQCFGDARADVRAGHPVRLQPKCDVVGDPHVGEQRVRLQHHTDAPLGRRQIRDIAACQPDRARRRPNKPGQRTQRRRLARPARAEQCDRLARRDPQTEVDQCVRRLAAPAV
jgi:hypothetical protein